MIIQELDKGKFFLFRHVLLRSYQKEGFKKPHDVGKDIAYLLIIKAGSRI